MLAKRGFVGRHDHLVLDLGEAAFMHLGMQSIAKLGNHHADDGVAQEFQPFLVDVFRVGVGIARRMGERQGVKGFVLGKDSIGAEQTRKWR